MRPVSLFSMLKCLSIHFCQIPEEWNIEEGKVHLGVKNAFDLYPKMLKDRMVKERREKHWDADSREAIAAASKALEIFETAHPNPTSQVKVVFFLKR